MNLGTIIKGYNELNVYKNMYRSLVQIVAFHGRQEGPSFSWKPESNKH